MKDKILEILKDASKPLDVFEIEEQFQDDMFSLEDLLKVLHDLEVEALIYHTNKDKYMLYQDSHLKKGIMHANKKGFGFVDIDDSDEDVFIREENLNGALHGDLVVVEIISKKNVGRMEGRIVRVLKHEKDTYVGEVFFRDSICYVKLDDSKMNLQVIVQKENTLNAVEGHKVVVQIVKRLSNSQAEGNIVKVIGHKNDPGVDILSIVYKYNIEDQFPEAVREYVSTMPNAVTEEDKKGRVDLTKEMIFTIDGDDTKDIDDAISVKILSNGNYELGVHIADVSYYVKEGSVLDEDAMERGTSVYLVDRVIPMLPHELSNGICSLNPNVERLAISCVMEIDPKGKVVDYRIFESVIQSNIQMTYKKVNSILENNIIPEGYEPYVETLHLMEELSHILRKMKDDRGNLDFDVDEAKILVDENCHPTKIVVRERGTGEKLIEDFMIAANECVATHIYYMELPFIYRIHEYPKEEKIRSFLTFMGTLGYSFPGNLKDVRPKTIQKLLNYLRDKPEFPILSSLLLRNMQKAIYNPDNSGHYGLASSCYTHFTSPIRRYPDTTVHRLLRTYLFNHNLSRDTIAHWQEKLVYVAEHSSSKEQASINCERDVEDMKMAEYMEDHIGETYEGMISSVMSFGMFVQLDNLIEGLVPIRDMKDFFHYDEETLTLTGERSKIKYTIGERVVVKVVRANKQEGTIDFEVVKKVKE